MKKIILAFDGSEAAFEAACAAADVAQRIGAEVIVLKVGRLMEAVDGLLLPTMDEDPHWWIAEAGAGLVRQLGAVAEARMEWGDPAREIVRLAEQERAAFVVIGQSLVSRNRLVFSKSLASKVVDHAPCPVLVVPANGRVAATSGAEADYR